MYMLYTIVTLSRSKALTCQDLVVVDYQGYGPTQVLLAGMEPVRTAPFYSELGAPNHSEHAENRVNWGKME